ncbi:antimicrobial peptide NK-lysin-like [Ornithorhynchus anatinus]|uniref:antimicrobial peptide NK-lysin-like n=1 Tax=Ornithorhynchus anatinus TaxID=9258 RepID=UPI0010A8C72F|nr:antimicrobial peptide NK-lysin-like [Ornithorhynchus anatinus]
MAAFLLLLSLTLLAGPAWASTGLISKDHRQEPTLRNQQHQQDSSFLGDLRDQDGSPFLICSSCQIIMQKLKDMVGNQINDTDAIDNAEKRLCRFVGFILRTFCRKLMKTYMYPIAIELQAGKSPWDVCVDISLCKPMEDQDAREKILESESTLEKRTLEAEWPQPARRSLWRY